jgi:hypothetical protein
MKKSLSFGIRIFSQATAADLEPEKPGEYGSAAT